jgi:hypothetical protein
MGKPKRNTGTIQSSAGIDHNKKEKIIRIWKEYTEELHKKDTKTYTEVQEKAYTKEPPVMKSEFRKALRGTARHKATGTDELQIELMKAAGKAAITALTTLCQQMW